MARLCTGLRRVPGVLGRGIARTATRVDTCSAESGEVFSFRGDVFSFAPNVFSFAADVSSFRANVSSFGPDVSRSRVHVSGFRADVSTSSPQCRGCWVGGASGGAPRRAEMSVARGRKGRGRGWLEGEACRRG